MQKKKILCALLVIAILFSGLDVTAFATELPETVQTEETDEGSSENVPTEEVSTEETSEGQTEEIVTTEESEEAENASREDEQSNTEESYESEEASASDEEASTETEDIYVEETVETEEETAPTIVTDNMSVEANSGLGELLLDDLQIAGAEASNEKQKEYSISEITVNDKTATVSFHTVKNCTLIVGIYEEETSKPIVYGTKMVSQGDTVAEIEMSIETMPQYFEVRGYLVNTASLRPLSDEYSTEMYTQAMQEFLAKTTDDFDADRVVNLDESKETNFAVVNENNALVVQETGINELVSYDEATRTYVFENIDESFNDLAAGDVFVYHYDESNIAAFKIETITINETTATIVAEEEKLEADDVFDFIRIDERADSSDTVINQEDCPEGVTYVGKVDENGNPIEETVQLDADAPAVDGIGNEENPLYVGNVWRVNLSETPEGYKDDKVEGSCDVEIGLGITVTYYYQKMSVWYVDIKLDATFKVSGNIEAKAEISIPLNKFELETNLLTCNLTPKFVIGASFEGKINAHLTGSCGVTFGAKEIETYNSAELVFLEVDGELSTYIGFKFEPEIEVLDGKVIEAKLKTGILLNITAEFGNQLGVSNSNDNVQHSCEECISGTIGIDIPFEASLGVLGIEGIDLAATEASFDLLRVIFGKFYYSITYNEFGWGECPHNSVLVTVTVKDDSIATRAVEGAVVSVDNATTTATTDAKGKATLNVAPGTRYFYASYKTEDGVTQTGSVSYPVSGSLTKPVVTLGTMEKLPDEQFVRYIQSGRDVYSDIAVFAAITKENELYMSGENCYGQLGNGSTTDQHIPIKISVAGKKVKTVATDGSTTAAITKDGKLYIWGFNNIGQLGLGDTTNKTIPQMVELPGNVAKVVVYDKTVAALLENGDLYMWGYNGYRFGDGTTTAKYIPTYIMADVEDIKWSSSCTAVLKKNKDLYLWGTVSDLVAEAIIEIPEEPVVSQVSSFEINSENMAVITTNNELYMWGRNGVGQLGNQSTTSTSVPQRILSNVKKVIIDSKNDFSAAIMINGDLYVWGGNYTGQLGIGDTQNRTIPTKVNEVKNVNDIKASRGSHWSGSSYFTRAVTERGEVWRWGGSSHNPVKILSKDVCIIELAKDGSDVCWTQMDDGSIWKDEYGNVSRISLKDNELETAALSLDAVATLSSATNTKKTASYTNLLPNELYNLYVMKSKDADAPLDNDNILCIAQGVSDAEGNLSIDYTMKEDYASPDIFVMSQTEPNIANATVTIENLIHDGTEQFVAPKVIYDDEELVEGKDYFLAGDFSATEIGEYTLTIIGTGLYTGSIEVTYQVEPMVYTIIFDSDGGSFVESQGVIETGCAVKPEDPIKDGFRFTGWYLNGQLYDFTKVVTDSFTLVAGWEELETLSAPVSNIDSETSVKAGTKIILSCSDTEAVIYYTTDESEPTKESKIYNKPIVLSKDTVIKAFASKEGYKDSEVVTFTYTVSNPTTDEDTFGTVLPEDIPEDGIPEGLWIAGVEESYLYTGTAIKPEVRVYDGDKRLQAGRDYTISYKNNVKANDASVAKKAPTITVKGKGNYSGTETKTFRINQVDLSDSSVTAEDVVVAYNGKIQKPVPVVTFNGKKLKNKKDFTVSYSAIEQGTNGANKEVGSYELIIQAKAGGNFTGSKTIQLVVTNSMLMSKVKVKKIPNQSYADWNGAAVEPKLTVTMNGKPDLIEGKDYTVTYENNTQIGTATAILTGMGDYAGTKKVTFKITGDSIKNAIVTGIVDATYDGTEKKPVPVVSLNGKTLTEGVNYEVSYSDNVNAGKATVIITGINDCTGTVKKNFKITAFDLEADANKNAQQRLISGLDGSVSAKYVKGGSQPTLKLTYNDVVLKEGKDYTITYKNNKAVATASAEKAPTMIIKGKGNFCGTITKLFTIEGKALDDVQSPVTITADDIGYVNKAGKFISKPVLTDADGTKLKEGKDYEVVYTTENGSVLTKKNKVNANTIVKVKATGKGVYEGGTIETTYTVTPADFKKAKISINPQVYTGDAIYLDKDAMKEVKINGINITDEYGTSYEIVEDSYKNNVKKGTASVTIKGKGNYGGTKTVKFKITAKNLVWFWRIFG